jgi:hypothetical protein
MNGTRVQAANVQILVSALRNVPKDRLASVIAVTVGEMWGARAVEDLADDIRRAKP